MLKHLLVAASLVVLGACSDEEESVNSPMDPTAAATPALPGSDLPGTTPSLDQGGILDDQVQNSLDAQKFANQQVPNPSQFIEGEGQTQAQTTNNPGKRYVAVHSLHVRKAPGMSSKSVGYLPFNAEIQILEVKGNGAWGRIANNKWVGMRYLSSTKNNQMVIPAKFSP